LTITGDFEVIRREESNGDATFQWVYKGLPLYFFIDDNELGDTGGDFPTWKIARP
jgi:predicted lipoprotein with Yx(FWY)xxD motif